MILCELNVFFDFCYITCSGFLMPPTESCAILPSRCLYNTNGLQPWYSIIPKASIYWCDVNKMWPNKIFWKAVMPYSILKCFCWHRAWKMEKQKVLVLGSEKPRVSSLDPTKWHQRIQLMVVILSPLHESYMVYMCQHSNMHRHTWQTHTHTHKSTQFSKSINIFKENLYQNKVRETHD